MGLLSQLFGEAAGSLRMDFRPGHAPYWLDAGELPDDILKRFGTCGGRLAETVDRKWGIPLVVSEPRTGDFGTRIENLQSKVYEATAAMIGGVEQVSREAVARGDVCFALGRTSDGRRHVAVTLLVANQK